MEQKVPVEQWKDGKKVNRASRDLGWGLNLYVILCTRISQIGFHGHNAGFLAFTVRNLKLYFNFDAPPK